MPATNKGHAMQVRTVDARIAALRNAAAHARRTPVGGWLKTLRQAFGLTYAQLAQRLHVTAGAIQDLEANERDGSITLARLRKVAEVLDAEVVYMILPRKSIKETLNKRAHELARERIGRVAHSMDLEQQSVTNSEQEQQIEDYARELLNRPRELWR
jgi:predicted DNA-binding mobile mystery protein A